MQARASACAILVPPFPCSIAAGGQDGPLRLPRRPLGRAMEAAAPSAFVRAHG